MSYAIVETGGKQYKVQPGDVIYVEKLDAAEETEITLDKVLALSDENGLKVGAPYLEGVAVPATVLKNGKAKKITVFTYKPKKNVHRKLGHRQPYTKLQIGEIGEAKE
jgi:large subunit ribosomal protein L21